MKRYLFLIILSVVATVTVTSCYSPDPYVRYGRRSGAVLGGVTGAVIGNNVRGGNSWGGAAIGASIGGLAGGHRGRVNSMYYGGQSYGRSYRGRRGYRYY